MSHNMKIFHFHLPYFRLSNNVLSIYLFLCSGTLILHTRGLYTFLYIDMKIAATLSAKSPDLTVNCLPTDSKTQGSDLFIQHTIYMLTIH